MALLPGNQILFHIRAKFFLFNIDDAPVTTLDPSQYLRGMTEIESVAELSLYADTISQPYFLHDSTGISVLTRSGASGVIVPHPNGVSRSEIKLVSLWPARLDTQNACVSYNHALVCCWPEITTLQYVWSDSLRCGLIAERNNYWTSSEECDEWRERCWPEVFFDDSSGYILLSVPKTKTALVLGIGTV